MYLFIDAQLAEPRLFILQIIFSPVEVAIEDMRDKINKLKEVLSNAHDTKLLQMQLQGGIATSVNQGPYAIAHAFLGAVPASEQNHFHQQLRMCFREFVKLYVNNFTQLLCMTFHLSSVLSFHNITTLGI